MANRAGESPAITEPSAGYSRVDETESISKREAKRRLRSRLGITGAHANRLMRSEQFLEAATIPRPLHNVLGILDPTGETVIRNDSRGGGRNG